jgi:cell division protein FtsI (penicillin-binding protein 3)
MRLGALTLALVGLFVLASIRLVVIVLIDGPRLVSLARSEQTAVMELAAVRGPIADRDGKPLALSAETPSIFARPRNLLENSSPAQRGRLAALLGIMPSELESRLRRGAPFVWLARHLPPDSARAVEELGLEGAGAVNEYKRFYPESSLAAAVVGMAGTDGQGLSGVELQYDHLIRGEPVELRFYRDAFGHPILDSPLELKTPQPGARLELTIDASIQSEAESYLIAQIKQSGASRGAAVVLDPFTGEVLALANVGGQKPEIQGRLHDSAVQDAFEPGSTMKGLLGAIALEDRAIDPSREIYCEQGEWHVAGRAIHDDSRHGWLNLGGIIEVSSNIGAAKIALALGARRFYQGLTAFGLGRKSGIDLPGEASGLLRPPSSWREIELADHGFGQGVAVTPIQLATAYAAIANGGVLIRPHVLKAAYDANGRELLVYTPQVMRRAISPATAHSMNELLRGVVNGRDGTARLAQVADFTVAGKTGTAQMINPATGTYYPDRLVASFVGFVPADDPKLVILVVLYDVPHGHFGGLVAAPVFSLIASDALRRLDVAPNSPSLATASLLPFGDDLAAADSGQNRARAANAAAGAPEQLADGAEETIGRTPDFRGLSLRAALALARARKLALEVNGSGYVIRQEPEAGAASGGGSIQILLAAPGTAKSRNSTSPDLHTPRRPRRNLVARRERMRVRG